MRLYHMYVYIRKNIVNIRLGTIHGFRHPLAVVKHNPHGWGRTAVVLELRKPFLDITVYLLTSVLTQTFLGAVSMMLTSQFWALLNPEWGMPEVGDSGNSPPVQWYFKFMSSSPILLPLFIFQSPQIVAYAFKFYSYIQ